jgi:hypothetical protein
MNARAVRSDPAEACFLAWHRLTLLPGSPAPFVLVPMALVSFGGFRDFLQVSASGRLIEPISASRHSLRCLRLDPTPEGEICPAERHFVRTLRESARACRHSLPRLELSRCLPAWSGWKGNAWTSTLLARHGRQE